MLPKANGPIWIDPSLLDYEIQTKTDFAIRLTAAEENINTHTENLSTTDQNISDHENNKSNPHEVTAEQIGVYTKTESDNVFLSFLIGVSGSGEKLEVVEMSIVSNGTTPVLTGSATFSKTYINPPTVIYAGVSQIISYSESMISPYIDPTFITTEGFQCRFTTAYNGITNNFGNGTLKVKFLVIGK
jgi:hypothetical protein